MNSDNEIDAFSVALAAADTVKITKSKKMRTDDHILAEIKKSLADLARPIIPHDTYSTVKRKKTEIKDGKFYIFNRFFLLI